MNTYDRMGVIQVTLDRTLGKKSMEEYYLLDEVLQREIYFFTETQGLVDGWGNVMRVTIQCFPIKKEIHIKITSAGRDGVMDTGDDLMKEIIWVNQFDLLELFDDDKVWTLSP